MSVFHLKTRFLIILFIVPGDTSPGQDETGRGRIPENDRIRLAEAFRIADQFGSRIWEDWNKVPFAVLLVTRENEFLLRHPNPSNDFGVIGHDSLLECTVYFRNRVFNPHLLATFPAIGGVSTIVIGQAENTQAQHSSRWVLTLLHEHFHQLQQGQPDYYESVNTLGLSGGDQSGMWMLNYPFPYDSSSIDRGFMLLARTLHKALNAEDAEFSSRLDEYVRARTMFKETLSSNDYVYFSFQLWQEGVARYTEVRLAEMLSREYQPTAAFRSLADYRSFQDVYQRLRDDISSGLLSPDLRQHRRSAFYAFGAAEALVLDRAFPEWRTGYFPRKFSLDSLFPAP